MKPAVRKEDAPLYDGHPPLTVRLRPIVELTADHLLELSSLNRDLRLELTAKGELIVMPPVGGESSRRNAGFTSQIWVWARQDGTGTTFDSSTGFTLSNGAVRSPDAAWVKNSRLEALSPEQREKYLPLCPDFVIELRLPSDALSTLQEKMVEYLENGARSGLLVDPKGRRVYLCRPDEPVRQLEDSGIDLRRAYSSRFRTESARDLVRPPRVYSAAITLPEPSALAGVFVARPTRETPHPRRRPGLAELGGERGLGERELRGGW